MRRSGGNARILIYSHDTFGLGHLRRCRTIAHSLVAHRRDISVLILSGSPIIGSFDFRSRVDFVRIPGVVKLKNGEYTTQSLDIAFEDAINMRSSIIRHTAEAFDPDIFLVDKEPLGLRGEVRATLEWCRENGTRTVLGLRDVMDDPEALAEEWGRKQALPALQSLYDDIWVYGLADICQPLAGVVPPGLIDTKTTYTGYLRRHWDGQPHAAMPTAEPTLEPGEADPYILVTPGGGGDGAGMVDWVLRAYERHPDLNPRAVMVLGPFMHKSLRAEFQQRADRLDQVQVITFDAHIESLMAQAVGVVAMGGYNTFCEILSFDKPSLIVPRTVPRLEQYIRASRAEELGLCSMLVEDTDHNPSVMAEAIAALPARHRPSEVHVPGLLDGLSTINRAVDHWLTPAVQPVLPAQTGLRQQPN
ncbi:MAG: glycosyltransferase family protein [Magnetovibrionaceae bacterium]